MSNGPVLRDPSLWTPVDTARAQQIWAEYQHEHDVSTRIGQTAGIDPNTGRVWIADSAEDILDQMEEAIDGCEDISNTIESIALKHA